jgi:resuscitation-promoting factor RpfB
VSLLAERTPEASPRTLSFAAPRPPRQHRLRTRLVALGSVGLIGSAVVAGSLFALNKTVTITVDGATQQISTFSGSVSGALEAAGLSVGEHDQLAPAGDVSIVDGSIINLNRGRLVTVTISGVDHQIWTTARTLDEALAELGADTSAMKLSADRGREIPLDGISLTAVPLHTVTLTDGTAAASTLSSGAVTVGELLAEAGLTLGPRDTVTPDASTPVTEGLSVAIARTTVATVVENVEIPQPADIRTEDPTLNNGTVTVKTQGAAGTAAVTYEVTSVNGVQTAKTEISRATVVAPVTGEVLLGTKSTLRWVGNQVFFDDFEFGVNWDGLAKCESTHNPKAVNANPSAGLPTYGLFQFDLPTWQSVGGTGNPINATPEEQIKRAKMLFQKRGLQPWACRHAA